MAGELAVGVVSGRERADGLAHLAECRSCNDLVADLAQSADALLALGPSAEPPAGFESKVLQRVQAEQRPLTGPAPLKAFHPLTRRHLAVVVAAAAAVILLAGVVTIAISAGGRSDAPVAAHTRTATMTTPGGRDVGRVVLTGRPDSVFVALPGWRQLEQRNPGYLYRLRAKLSDGRTLEVGPMRLVDPEATWGTVARFDVRTVRSVAMVDEDGRVLCSATLPA